MKNLIALILTLSFSCTLFGQNILTSTVETWSGGTWLNQTKSSNTYNGSGYLTFIFQQSWDAQTNSWKDAGQITYTNNPDGTAQQYVSQYWDSQSNGWVNSGRGSFTYSNSTGINEINEISFSLFPNPSNDVLNLWLENNSETRVKITDVQGKLLLSKLITEGSSVIDIKYLPSNLYIIHLVQDNKMSSTKFIKSNE